MPRLRLGVRETLSTFKCHWILARCCIPTCHLGEHPQTATPRQRSLCCGENVNRNKYGWIDVHVACKGLATPLLHQAEPAAQVKHYGDFWSCTTVFGIIRLNFMSLTHGNAFENSAHDDFELWGSKRARTRVCVWSADPKPKGRSIMAVLAHGTTDRQDEDHNGPGLTIQSVMSTGVETTFVSSVVPALVGGYIGVSNLNIPTTV
ncbi:hypothetical protein F5I97DRAFT_1827007 [Phlebopus sp. FC_14]|nr:hypothetical protein F5I97DRAFT_1827007 [Phlebopus sp. FC_14]